MTEIRGRSVHFKLGFVMGGYSSWALVSLALVSLLLPSLALHTPSAGQALPLHPSSSVCPAAAGALRIRGGGVFGLFRKPPPPPAPKPAGVMAALSSLGMGPMEGAIFVLMAIITHFARPSTLTPVGGMSTIQHVFYYGWVAALSTGLGALPLMFMGAVKDHWLGLSNAIAAGMMLSASFGLMEEGVSLDPDGSMILGYGIDHYTRVAVGFVLGMWSVSNSNTDATPMLLPKALSSFLPSLSVRWWLGGGTRGARMGSALFVGPRRGWTLTEGVDKGCRFPRRVLRSALQSRIQWFGVVLRGRHSRTAAQHPRHHVALTWVGRPHPL